MLLSSSKRRDTAPLWLIFIIIDNGSSHYKTVKHRIILERIAHKLQFSNVQNKYPCSHALNCAKRRWNFPQKIRPSTLSLSHIDFPFLFNNPRTNPRRWWNHAHHIYTLTHTQGSRYIKCETNSATFVYTLLIQYRSCILLWRFYYRYLNMKFLFVKINNRTFLSEPSDGCFNVRSFIPNMSSIWTLQRARAGFGSDRRTRNKSEDCSEKPFINYVTHFRYVFGARPHVKVRHISANLPEDDVIYEQK